MNGLVGQFNPAECDIKQVEIRTPNPAEQLHNQKKRLEMQLADINQAIEFLDKHPDFLLGLTLLTKATGRY